MGRVRINHNRIQLSRVLPLGLQNHTALEFSVATALTPRGKEYTARSSHRLGPDYGQAAVYR